ncbi:EamA family transporter RarD [Aureimonas leprariae]|uniref:EamA family transporter RarD n=1 Tax=Plantimonas leprariae TaxID=2615207 RepID=A0A7V7PPT8_9HYPH|nr:EamA family transporter RarD [Aureimonas leprariae]KAB0680108.1 EamA family transporter RarD [Aureimonas leprariae]
MPTSTAETSRGFLFAVSAYVLWGLVLPLYMKSLSHVPPMEIVGHRIVWSVPIAAAILWWSGALRQALAKFRSPRIVALMATTAALITLNWSTYVYAIVKNHAVDAALGYYINPLVNVLMGAIFLGERPSRLQSLAILLAVVAVLILTVLAGGLPWISILLALSFGGYGLLRKMIPVAPAEGFFLEVAILALPALAVILMAVPEGPRHYVPHGSDWLLLFGAGIVTALPLILYAAGAKRLEFATLGILQYMAPTMIFLTAVFLFGEPFSNWQLVAFALIWTSVGIYIWSLLKQARDRRRDRASERASLTAEAA